MRYDTCIAKHCIDERSKTLNKQFILLSHKTRFCFDKNKFMREILFR